MKFKFALLLALLLVLSISTPRVESVTYVTDSGGGAWDESRESTNMAALVAFTTVGIAGIIALGVQNSHRSCSSCSSHSMSKSYSYSSSSSHSN